MKKIILGFVFASLSSTVFAITDEDLINKCSNIGKAKIVRQAINFGCEIDINQIEVEGIDSRWYNPSKYVWYQIMGKCNDYDRVIVLVQYAEGKCF